MSETNNNPPTKEEIAEARNLVREVRADYRSALDHRRTLLQRAREYRAANPRPARVPGGVGRETLNRILDSRGFVTHELLKAEGVKNPAAVTGPALERGEVKKASRGVYTR